MESDCCRLAGVDFLGAMEAYLWGRSVKNIKKTREEAKNAAKLRVEGKTICRASIYRAQNIFHFAVAKGSTKSVYATA